MNWRPLTKQESLEKAVAEGGLPDAPHTMDCYVCDTPIGDREWDWAAMPENGPVHKSCFDTDEQLLAQLDDQGPCTGCDVSCDKYDECLHPDVLSYADGVNNCMILRAGLDDVAEQYRAQGYKTIMRS